MTYQPPTPPPPPARSGGFDPKTVNPLDWGIIGAGALAFIFSFISYYTASVDTSGTCPAGIDASISSAGSESASAWHEIFGGGFFAWFAMLFAILGAVSVAIGLFAPTVKLPVAARLGGLGFFAAATVFIIIAIFVSPGDSYEQTFAGCTVEAGIGHGFGFWASLVVIIAGLALSLMRFQATGGQLPGGLQGKVPNIGGYGPQDGPGGAPGVQGAGYTPPGAPPAAPPAPPAPPRPAPPSGEAPPPPPPGYTPPSQ